jgi:hypothetical protein
VVADFPLNGLSNFPGLLVIVDAVMSFAVKMLQTGNRLSIKNGQIADSYVRHET